MIFEHRVRRKRRGSEIPTSIFEIPAKICRVPGPSIFAGFGFNLSCRGIGAFSFGSWHSRCESIPSYRFKTVVGPGLFRTGTNDYSTHERWDDLSDAYTLIPRPHQLCDGCQSAISKTAFNTAFGSKPMT